MFFCLVFAMPLYTSVYMCLVVTCWERADLWCLTVSLLLWVRCGSRIDCIDCIDCIDS